MQKERTIGTTTLKTPYIGMGTWAIGGGTWWGENDDALSIRTIEEAIDRGIVWFDTAPVYGIGHSENVVGTASKLYQINFNVIRWKETSQISLHKTV